MEGLEAEREETGLRVVLEAVLGTGRRRSSMDVGVVTALEVMESGALNMLGSGGIGLDGGLCWYVVSVA